MKRYLDPSYMKPTVHRTDPDDLAGHLPDIYKPFNALTQNVEVDDFLSMELESITEEDSKDQQDEFSFRVRVERQKQHDYWK